MKTPIVLLGMGILRATLTSAGRKEINKRMRNSERKSMCRDLQLLLTFPSNCRFQDCTSLLHTRNAVSRVRVLHAVRANQSAQEKGLGASVVRGCNTIVSTQRGNGMKRRGKSNPFLIF